MNGENRKKPSVAVIYSETTEESKESICLGKYFGALLANSGYSNVYIIGYRRDDKILDNHQSSRISFVHPITHKITEAPASDIQYTNWNALIECHVIIVTVNPKDTIPVAKKLTDVLKAQKNVVIIGLQRHVRNSSNLFKNFTSTTGCILLEGVVGFSVVPDSRTHALQSTIKCPGIVLERLTKENSQLAEGPVSLLEAADINVLYKKNITSYAWGVTLYECVYALTALTGESLYLTMRVWRWRVIYAAMIRECNRTLSAAAGSGRWKPDLQLITSLSPKFLEMILVLPNPLFRAISQLLDLSFSSVISPIQYDLSDHRETTIQWSLEEIINTGKTCHVHMPICEIILAHIRAVECMGVGGKVGYSTAPQVLATVEQIIFKSTPISVLELRYWAIRLLILLSVIPVLYFILFHE